MDTQILAFDTQLAGFKVAKILPTRLTASALSNLLTELKQQDVRLVYWLADSDDYAANQAAIAHHGVLASQHITYLVELLSLNPEHLIALAPPLSTTPTPASHQVTLYQDDQVSYELEQLAFAAGGYSHFQMDANFPHELFIKIYQEWIKNSVNKSYARDVIVIKKAEQVIAMATLGVKNDRGDIGLLAVDAKFRGKNLGTKIVAAAEWYFITQGFTLAQVVTQVANLPARRLYEKCGFKPEKCENFYHFWL